ncbi:hypothetical protein H0R92_00780 [Treponema sp. OMZ 840]|uniref:DUF6675 family protein n=1 Tax=Treponema sp. OMZ 840 TaxID=244313 RepID=UPI003D9167EB
MIKKHIFIFSIFFCAFSLFSQSLFNDNLTVEERQKLADGQIVIRNIGKAKNISLNPVTPQAGRLIESVKKLKPAYLAEVIQIRPASGNEDLIERIKPLLLDIEAYAGIPYWSERNQQFYDLYSSASIVKSDIKENGALLNADLYMLPFGDLNVDIKLSDIDGEVLYSMINTGNVKYDNITVVRPEKMQSFVYAFKYNDFIVLYGIGGVNAPSIFFLRDRIELSFINRIKTFCKYIFEKLE